jgi:putative flippase GtrA
MIKRFLNNHFVKFLLVGGLNTAFGYLIFTIVTYLVKNIYASVILSNVIAIIFNFNTYGKLVFHSKDHSKAFRFIAVYLLIISIQILLIKALNRAGVSNNYIAGGIILFPMALLSFLLMRNFVFRKETVKIDSQ